MGQDSFDTLDETRNKLTGKKKRKIDSNQSSILSRLVIWFIFLYNFFSILLTFESCEITAVIAGILCMWRHEHGRPVCQACGCPLVKKQLLGTTRQRDNPPSYVNSAPPPCSPSSWTIERCCFRANENQMTQGDGDDTFSPFHTLPPRRKDFVKRCLKIWTEGSALSSKPYVFPHTLSIWPTWRGIVLTGGMHDWFQPDSSIQINVVCFIWLELM